MTTLPRVVAETPCPRLVRPIEIGWSRTLSRWSENGAAESAAANARAFRRETLVVRLDPLDETGSDRAIFSSWVESHEAVLRRVHGPAEVVCSIVNATGLLHVEVSALPDRPSVRHPLRLTFDGSGSLLFAQSDLLTEAGYRGGGYDRAELRTPADMRQSGEG
ncbi:MAG: hypothetical protein EA377_05695 [Phycisphaerales bacterium]|nr:MAG: hypothetical protein EA377_05695 [Phycisphaerales bacterium]